MEKAFDITPGNYDIPEVGKINSFEPVSDEKLLAIYRLNRGVFPWIRINKNTLAYLKKQKFTAEEVARMIQNATTEEEAEMLTQLSDTKTVERIKEVKVNSLKNEEQKKI